MKTKQISQALSLSVDGLQCRLQKKQELAKLACLLESVISQSGLPCLSYEALCNSCYMFLVQTHLFRYNLCTRTTHISASESLAPQGLVLPQGRYCENFEAFGYRSKNPMKSYKIVSLGAECWGSHSASFTFLCVFARCYRQEKNSQQFYRKHYSLILLPRVFTVWNFTFCYCDVFLSLFFLYPFLP